MADNQAVFLARVRAALGREPGQKADGGGARFSRDADELQALLERGERTRAERLALLEVLRDAAGPLKLHVHEAADMHAAGEAVAAIAREAEPEWGADRRVVVHDTPLLAGLGLAGRLEGEPVSVDVAAYRPGEAEAEARLRLRREAAEATVGVTEAAWCAADCAAVALFSGPGRPRSTSLTPSVHVAVLELERLLADLPELYSRLEAEEAAEGLPTAVALVSGPSKTADIEGQLVHGAHGPRGMHLVVLTG